MGHRRWRTGGFCLVIVAVVLSGAMPAQALLWDVQYNGDVTPDKANPAWTQGGAASGDNSTVSGGVLTITNAGGKKNTWDRNNDPVVGGITSTFLYDDPATPEEDFVEVTGNAFTMEWKMKVNSPASGISTNDQAGVKIDLVLPPDVRKEFTFYYDSATQRLANTANAWGTNKGVAADGSPINDGFTGIAVGEWHTYKLTCAMIGNVWIRELWLDGTYVGRWSTEKTSTSTSRTVKMRVNSSSSTVISFSFDDVRYDAAPDGRYIRPLPTQVTGLSPTLFGKTTTPPSATITLRQSTVADGVVFRIDRDGIDRHYEIDFDGVWDPAHYRLPISSLDSDIAGGEMAAAINADPEARWFAAYWVPDGFRWLVLSWKDDSHYGASNAEVHDPDNVISVGSFGNQTDSTPAWINLQGIGLSEAESVTAVHSSGSPTITGTIIARTPDSLNVEFPVNPTASLNPPVGMYNVVVTGVGGQQVIENAFELVDNLLNDPSYRLFISGGSLSPNWNSWDSGMSPFWQRDNVYPDVTVIRNGRTWEIPNPRQYPVPTAAERTNAGDREHGTIQWSAGDGVAREMWQTVELNFAEETKLTLTGLVAGGVHTIGPMAYGVEMRLGGRDGTIIAQTPPSVIIDRFTWREFACTGIVPAGPIELTVVIWASSDSEGDKALHIDDLLLRVDTTSTVAHAVTSVSPAYGVRGAMADLYLTGTFVPSVSTAVLRRPGENEIIPATAVSATANTLQATFDLTTATPGFWDVVVSAPGHATLVAGQVFNVVLPGESLSNGGFELPEHVISCPPVEPVVNVTDWFVRQIGWYFRPLDQSNWNPDGNWFSDPVYVRRDVTTYFAPTCPPPEGGHYAATWSSMPEPSKDRLDVRRPLQVMQTVTVTPGATYTLSGFFAAAGANTVRLALLDGDCTQPPMPGAEVEVFNGIERTDWQLAYVTGTASSGLATALWETTNQVVGDKRSYADGLLLERVTGSVSLSAVSPTALTGGLADASLKVTGAGFSGGALEVFLVSSKGTLKANSVEVQSDSVATAMFTVPAMEYAAWDVVVHNHGTFAKLPAAVEIAPGALLNGEFELPGESLVCGPPPTPRHSPVTGWSYSGQLIRDGNVHHPASCPCPFSSGGHYGSMSTGDGTPQRAWQTLAVRPYGRYRFSGYFAGGGGGRASIKLVEGSDPDGKVLAQAYVNEIGEAHDWRLVSVEAVAVADTMTVLWELVEPLGICATHADGLVFESTLQCNTPVFDVEPDGDVDQDDFAFMQRCLTIGAMIDVPDDYCYCLDVEPAEAPDGVIDSKDMAALIRCAAGPGIEPDPADCP